MDGKISGDSQCRSRDVRHRRLVHRKFQKSLSKGSDFLISVREGKIANIEENPRFDRPRRVFAAGADVGVEQIHQPPIRRRSIHDFFAMLMRVDDFVLDGNTLATMQNARALHRMMNILKQMEPLNAAA